MNPIDWLPSAELPIRGEHWNLYGMVCMAVIIVSGVIEMRRTKKPLLYRMVLSFLLTWCLQIVIVDNVALICLRVFFGKVFSGSWVVHIGGVVPIELRIIYLIFPTGVLVYYAWVESKMPLSKRVFNWKTKWIWIFILVYISFFAATSFTGEMQSFRRFPVGSINRWVDYYFAYIPLYTLFTIAGIKMFKEQKPKVTVENEVKVCGKT